MIKVWKARGLLTLLIVLSTTTCWHVVTITKEITREFDTDVSTMKITEVAANNAADVVSHNNNSSGHHYTNEKENSNASRSCPSHYLQSDNDNEFSPLVFDKDNLVVCRTPKVGSLEVRLSSIAYKEQKSFDEVLQEYTTMSERDKEKLQGQLPFLSSVENETLFRQYLYEEEVDRILFVRHPVLRILSAFIELGISRSFWKLHGGFKGKPKNTRPPQFQRWILNANTTDRTNQSFLKYYHANCDNIHEVDLHPLWQHYAPPQQCRCGMHECGVQWKIYKLEEYPSIASILHEYLPDKYLKASSRNDSNVHSRRYNKSDYLGGDPRILNILNEATRLEQEYFGYQPLRLQHLD